MRLDEIVSLGDVLKASQFIRLMNGLKVKSGTDINITRVKNQILQSWKGGMKSRKHFNNLLGKINLSINDLIDK
jgi:hypothetical protein